tara:strand:- start:144 stop:497 length:354 start_codon:yes stop_codon:yes gene_type:complete
MGLVDYIKKNIVKYLVYFFIVIILYGLIEYVFFYPNIEGLKEMEKVQIESKIKKEIIEANKEIKKKNKNQDKEINSMKKTIIDLEEDMEQMKNSAEESKEDGEKAKAELLENAPIME